MLTYANRFRIELVDEPAGCVSALLTYADVCGRMLTYADVCRFRIELVDEPAGCVSALLNGYRDVMLAKQRPMDLWGLLTPP
jgi:hypothetical protein